MNKKYIFKNCMQYFYYTLQKKKKRNVQLKIEHVN